MTQKEKENYIRDKISFWQQILKLENWEIDFKIIDKLKIESPYANIEILWDAQKAIVEISERCPDEELDISIIHELAHIVTHPIAMFAEDIISELCEQKTQRILKNEINLKEENAVGKLSKAFLELDSVKKISKNNQ